MFFAVPIDSPLNRTHRWWAMAVVRTIPGDRAETPLASDYSGLITQTGATASRPFVPMAEGGGRIDSKTGTLHEVIVRRPGNKIAHLTPIDVDSLLFDDALNIPQAQAERNAFTAILRFEDVIVHDLRELFAEVLAAPEARRLVLGETVGLGVVGVSASELLIDYFQSLPDTDLAKVFLDGITHTELRECLSSSDERDLFSSTYLSTLEGPFVVTPLPNLLSIRDASVRLYGGVSVNSITLEPRRREAIDHEAVYRYHPAFGPRLAELAGSDAPEARLWREAERASVASTIEGGDFQILSNRTLVMGLTHRSTAIGMERLASQLFASGAASRIVDVHMPDVAFYTQLEAVMHLSTLVTMVSPDAHLRFPDFTGVTTVEIEPAAAGRSLQVTVHEGSQMDAVLAHAAGINSFRVISPDAFDETEALRGLARNSCNVMALAPGRVIGYAHNQRADDVLRKVGIEVVETPGVELVRGHGGSHCMTCPVTHDTV